ncbi:MAG: GTP-binding protein [Pseudomonadota bacterium]
MSQRTRDQIPVSVLTGFLGSGKTTVLNHLIHQPELSRTLVIINEFGEIGLDHQLVTQSVDDVVVEMSSGCLCCTIRGDLVRTLRDAPGRFARGGELWFDRVIIETTGLADPAPILHTLMTDPVIAPRFRLNGVLTVVDAVNGSATLDQQKESIKQVAVADHLVLTKTDLIETDALNPLQSRLRSLNPIASQTAANHGEVDPSLVINAGPYDPASKSLDVQTWLNDELFLHSHDHDHSHDHSHGHDDHDHAHNDVNRHDEAIRALCLTIDEPIAADAFDAWLEGLMLLRGEDILRIKGLINIDGLSGPMVLHGVQHVLHPPAALPAWPSEDLRTKIVFITRNIDNTVLRDTVKMLHNRESRPA